MRLLLNMTYIGRFAPTPSGPLHLGSLVAALGSYLAARAAKGRWLLRIDDLDQPRVVGGSEARILRQLEAHALFWDSPVRRQSEHVSEYEAALERLRQKGMIYACVCTRAQLARHVEREGDEAVYPGTCRNADLPDHNAMLRVRVGNVSAGHAQAPLELLDTASQEQAPRQRMSDFIVRRRDGQIAYQLACAVDEAAQGITEVVRGADLIASTFRQACLMRMLDLAIPRYRHLPLVVGADGRKFSKQNYAQALDEAAAVSNLISALKILGQPLPEGASTMSASELVDVATHAWRPENADSRHHEFV